VNYAALRFLYLVRLSVTLFDKAARSWKLCSAKFFFNLINLSLAEKYTALRFFFN